MNEELLKTVQALRLQLETSVIAVRGESISQAVLAVRRDELEPLVAWAEEQAKKEEEAEAKPRTYGDLSVGEQVRTTMDLGLVGKGNVGVVQSIDPLPYPFMIRFRSGRVYAYNRNELEKV